MNQPLAEILIYTLILALVGEALYAVYRRR